MKTLNDVCLDLWGWVRAAPNGPARALRGALVGVVALLCGLGVGLGAVVLAVWLADLTLTVSTWVLGIVGLCIGVAWMSTLLCSINKGDDDAASR